MSATYESAFQKGINAFRSSDYKAALAYFDEAINDNTERYTVYDSRAAVHEKLGNIKQALKDSRKVIQLAPHMRHGYSRSARLFMCLEKYDTALEMLRLALDRIKPPDTIHRAELRGLGQAITDARSAKAALESRRKSHISKLPVELISEIFTTGMEMDLAFPVSVALVCAHWRSVALSMPTLWRCVALSDVRPAQKIELWSERAKHRITALRIRGSISGLQLRDALTTRGPEFCKSLTSVHCDADLLSFVSCLASLPNVTDLNVDDIRVSRSIGEFVGEFAAEIVTPLGPLVPLTRPSSARSLVLEYVTVDWSIIAPRLSHLRILIIRVSSPISLQSDHIRTLLESNSHLEQVVLETRSPLNLAQAPTKARIALPRLSHLEFLGPMDAEILISRLSLPALECLVISCSLSAADRALLALHPPFPSLSALSIHKCSFSEAALSGFLKQMEALTKLEITYSGGNMDSIVDAVSGEAHRLIQQVDFSHCPSLNGGPIVRLVRPRLATNIAASTSASLPMPITSVHIDGCPRIDPSVPEWLRGRVENVSCVYMTKAEIKKIRR